MLRHCRRLAVGAIVPLLLALFCCQPPAAVFSFQDAFDRPDDLVPGNGWTPYAAGDGSSVTLANHAVALYGAATNSAGIYRTFDRFSGDFTLSVKVILSGSDMQLWMQNDTGALYLTDFALTGIDIRKENTVLQNTAFTGNANRLYEIVFRKTGTTLIFKVVEVSNPAVQAVVQATDSSYSSFMGLQIWGGANNNTTWISYVSLVNE
jgi:hypothetical protein